MTGIIRPRPWKQQPQIAVGIDWGNPITKDLAYLFAFGASRLDATLKLPPLVEGNPAFVATDRGMALTLNGAGAPFTPNGAGIVLPPSHTIFGWVRPTDTAPQFILQAGQNLLEYPTYSLSIGNCSNSGVDNKFNYVLNSDSGAIPVSVQTQTSTIVVGEWYFVVGTHDITTFNLYINGKLESTGGGCGALPDQTFSARLYIGGDDNASFTGSRYKVSGLLQNVGAFRRCLTYREVASLYKNFWQVFRPRVT